jgi:hypothetical protein
MKINNDGGIRKTPNLLKGEQIKEIKGYEKLYSITSFGRVWSHPKKAGKSNRKGKWLKQTLINRYPSVHLSKNGKEYRPTVHRLVALHFIDNPNNEPMVNHKDLNRENNIVSNLEWCNGFHNMQHAAAMGAWGKLKNVC